MLQNIRQTDGLLCDTPQPGQKMFLLDSQLPKEGETNILITTALPYCNNAPHLGNIVGSILSADVYSRYSRTRNRRTLYICGTDEYGTATETQALKENIAPKALCDKYYELHREVYNWFEIGYIFDVFGRTSSNLHKEFLADRLVEGICPKCGYACQRDRTHSVVARPASHMYIKLNEIQPRLKKWIQGSWSKGKWNPNAIVTGDGEIMYGSTLPSIILVLPPTIPPNGDNDNAYFHTVFWPSVQLGDGRDWTMLHHISTTEFLNYEGGKFSKSRNRGVFGPAAKETGVAPSITVNNGILLNKKGKSVPIQQSSLGNALFAEDPKRCAQVVSRAINLIYALSAVVYPFMPSTSESILKQLNAPPRTVPTSLGNDILPGHMIGAPAYLFAKIDENQAEIWRAKFGGETRPPKAAAALGPPRIAKKTVSATTVVDLGEAAAKATTIEGDETKSDGTAD
ncbi:hypothetical protein BU17DRAFT_69853 [Hysterangium stoloniferum]|nr:hypothetical protein BU17DRAFT_69853 [Hysterangium stoloniferum]